MLRPFSSYLPGIPNMPNLPSFPGGGGFDPASLFKSGEVGWVEPMIPGVTLFQDAAGTVPVTGPGQPVGLSKFTAGGALGFVQTDNAKRPTYMVDANGNGYLQHNGTSQWMVTAAINWATDKATIVAGVRKLSDAAQAIVFETSAAFASNNGALTLQAPVGASASFGFGSKGTAASNANVTTGYASPVNAVMTGIGDIANDVSRLRINGVQVASPATDQGTGNYGTYAIYAGARGGTSLFFNGNRYPSFGINRLLAATELAQVEAWAGRFLEPQSGVSVSTAAALVTALGAAAPGDTIILENGAYTNGSYQSGTAALRLNGIQKTGTVTVKARNPGGVTIAGLEISACKNIALQGVQITGRLYMGDSQDLTFYRCTMPLYHGSGSFSWQRVTFEECDFREASFYTECNTLARACTGLTFKTCIFGSSTKADDHVQLKGFLTNVLIENCTFYDIMTQDLGGGTYVHGDFIQALALGGFTPTGITIRGNHFVDLSATSAAIPYLPQGIFFSDGTYENIVIEQNLMSLATDNNGITISQTPNTGTDTVFVRNNSCLKRDDNIGMGIAVGNQSKSLFVNDCAVTGNIAKSVLNDTGTATVSGNYTYGTTAMTTLVDWTTQGKAWQDFLPKAGGPVESGYGAAVRLAALQAGARYYHPTLGLLGT